MFEFEYWSDVFLEHYVFSILISFLIIIITFIITKVYDGKNMKYTDSQNDLGKTSSQTFEKDETVTASFLKKSPAIAAEKVIEANMTEEQRRRESEVRQKQLSQIYQLMQNQTDKFGNISLSEIEEQFKLYQ